MLRKREKLIWLCIIAGSLAASDVFAAVRTCQAKWEMIRQDTGGRHDMEVFEVKGSCGGNVPNRCRKRARSSAQECMKTHWAQRKTPPEGPWVRPDACTSGKSVFGYHVGNLKCRIERKIKELGWCGKRVRLMRVTGGPTDHCDSRENVDVYLTDDTCSKVEVTCSRGADPVTPQ